MKKIIRLWPLLILSISSCQKKGEKPAADPWAGYRKAYEQLSINKDTAFLYFNRLAENSRDKQQTALAYYNMALIQSDAGDHYGTQESLTMSLKSLDERRPEDRNYLATDYNELSMACFSLEDNTWALNYSEKALNYADDPNLRHYILNNKGNALRKLKNYKEAILSYEQVMRLTKKNSAEYARALTNLATTKWLRDPAYQASPELYQALLIRIRQKDTWGENSSYAHLSDFYQKTKPDSALFYAKKMNAVARKLKSPDDELLSLQKLILLDDPAKIRSYYLRHQFLSDSLETVRNAAKNQFALIRYGVEKSKTDNLKLQKDNSEKRYQLGLVLLLVLIGIVTTAIWYRKRKKQQELDKQEAVHETRQKASKKVHDTLANDAYRIMKQIQQEDLINREWLLYNIDDLYVRARDISYDIIQAPGHDFYLKVSELLKSFGTDETKVLILGNKKDLWEKVDPAHQFELKYILQELMVNMRKHSGASNVVVKFELIADRFMVSYYDDGIGLAKDVIKKNGLTNTGNRIKAIGGDIIFDTGNDKGFQINLSFPVIKTD